MAALAGPIDTPLGRAAEELVEQRYARMDGDINEPAGARWKRRSSGSFFAWQWPDEVVQSYEKRDGDTVLEKRRYDNRGEPLTITTFTEGVPTSVRLALVPAVEVDVSNWTARSEGPLKLRLPGERSEAEGGARYELSGGSFEVWKGSGDPTTREFAVELVEECGCVLEERGTAWVDGQRGVHFAVRIVGPVEKLADLWVFPRGDEVWFLSYRVAAEASGWEALAPGRAAVALATFEESP